MQSLPSDPERRKVWLNQCNLNNTIERKYACSKKILSDDYLPSNSKEILKQTEIPCLRAEKVSKTKFQPNILRRNKLQLGMDDNKGSYSYSNLDQSKIKVEDEGEEDMNAYIDIEHKENAQREEKKHIIKHKEDRVTYIGNGNGKSTELDKNERKRALARERSRRYRENKKRKGGNEQSEKSKIEEINKERRKCRESSKQYRDKIRAKALLDKNNYFFHDSDILDPSKLNGKSKKLDKKERKRALARERQRRYRENKKKEENEQNEKSKIEEENQERIQSRESSMRYRNKIRVKTLLDKNNCFFQDSPISDPSMVSAKSKILDKKERKRALARERQRRFRENKNRIHMLQIRGLSGLEVTVLKEDITTPIICNEPVNVAHTMGPNNSFSISDEDGTNMENMYNSNSHVRGDYDTAEFNELTVANNTQNNQNIVHFCQDQPHQHIRTYTSFIKHTSAHREFQKQFFENDFGHACDICDRLWFKNDLKKFTNDETTPNINFIRSILINVDISEIKICTTCSISIKKKNIPLLSVYNGFKYPHFPDHLKNCQLNLVTERLISPRIPFMQIRRLRHVEGHFGIYGQVINVPLEVDTMVNLLPRNVDDDHCVTVHIKKKKIDKSGSVYQLVNKEIVEVWLRYLITTPLYLTYNIKIDENFFNDQTSISNVRENQELYKNNILEEIPFTESLVAQQQSLIWNDDMYIRIAQRQGNDPVNLLFDTHHEELYFPQIYLGQFRTFRKGVCPTPFMMATSELRRSDRRGVTPHHLLYMAMKIIRAKVRDSRPVAFKHIGKCTNSTKENDIQNCIESDLSFLRSIPNSTNYWLERKRDLFAMIRQLGKPTVFFTINANEIGWPHLIQLLYKLKHNKTISPERAARLHYMEKSTLINEDAVTCAIYFNKLINVIMNILQSKKCSPFKKYRVLHYFKRIEFHHEGSPRAHIFAWLENAPTNTLGDEYQKTVELIDTLISVSTAESSGNIKLQIHKHTTSCYNKNILNRAQECRFDAPFMPSKTSMILTPMINTEFGYADYKRKYYAIRTNLDNLDYNDFESFYHDNNIETDQEYVNVIRAGINRPTVFLKRQPHEKWHNPFNPFLLNVVKSYTGFQFITEEYACATYVAEYVNKTNRGVSNLLRKITEIMDDHPELDIAEITKNISFNILKHTEMTSQEAAWYLLREPMSTASTVIAYIPTVLPRERLRTKKTMKELNELEDDCTDMWKENWFDKYEKRPKHLEDISLAKFVSRYYKNKMQEYGEREEPRVIRYRSYDMATEFNEYTREMVTLHIPFRSEEEEILSEMKFIQKYEDHKDVILHRRKEFEANVDIKKIMQICRQLCGEEVSFEDLYSNPKSDVKPVKITYDKKDDVSPLVCDASTQIVQGSRKRASETAPEVAITSSSSENLTAFEFVDPARIKFEEVEVEPENLHSESSTFNASIKLEEAEVELEQLIDSKHYKVEKDEPEYIDPQEFSFTPDNISVDFENDESKYTEPQQF